MHIKKFEAYNMIEALRLIKQEFGSEAVILSAETRKKRTGVFGLPKKSGVEVTAATDRYYPGNGGNNSSNGRGGFSGDQSGRFDSSTSRGIGPAKNRLYPMDGIDRVQQAAAKELFPLYQQMLGQGVDQEIALDLIGKVNKMVSSGRIPERGELKACLIRACEEMGIKSTRIKIKHGKQNVVAFIGPTGVGKTTTVARLAAMAHACRNRDRVALITLDDERIAGISQLKVYADIIGIPVEVATSKNQLRQSVKRLSNNDLVLIDTPGISVRNENRINELKGFFEEIHPVEIHLLLSATTKEKDLKDIFETCNSIPISGLIFTKLDDSSAYGNILNQLVLTKIPVSYFTNGQRVPEDIEAATLKKLVDLIVNQENETSLWSIPPETLAGNMTELETRLGEGDDDFRPWMSPGSEFDEHNPVLNAADRARIYNYSS